MAEPALQPLSETAASGDASEARKPAVSPAPADVVVIKSSGHGRSHRCMLVAGAATILALAGIVAAIVVFSAPPPTASPGGSLASSGPQTSNNTDDPNPSDNDPPDDSTDLPLTASLVSDFSPGSRSSDFSGLAVLDSKVLMVGRNASLVFELMQFDAASGIVPVPNTPALRQLSTYPVVYDGQYLMVSRLLGAPYATLLVYDPTVGLEPATSPQGAQMRGVSSVVVLGTTVYFAGQNSSSVSFIFQYTKAAGIAATSSTIRGVAVLAAGAGRLFASALPAVPPSRGRELWSWSPATGDVEIADINAGSASSSPKHMTMLSATLVCFAATNTTVGEELFCSDVATNLTYLVADIIPGSASSNPAALTVFENKLMFAASTAAHGVELWSWSPTSGLKMYDVNPGSSGSSPNSMVIFNNQLFMAAGIAGHGSELAVFNGTGVQLAAEMRDGNGGGFPKQFVQLSSMLVFVARNGDAGIELHTAILTPS